MIYVYTYVYIFVYIHIYTKKFKITEKVDKGPEVMSVLNRYTNGIDFFLKN